MRGIAAALRVGVYALPFGYGPASKATVIAERLDALYPGRITWTFVSSGLGLELLSRSSVPARHVDAGSVHVAEDVALLLERELDALVVVMHRPLTNRLAPQLPVFCVDSLSYMWKEDSFADFPGIRSVARYYVQDLFGSFAQMQRTGVPNVVAVPPIIDVDATGNESDPVDTVFSLGGLLNPFSKDQEAYVCGIARVITAISGPRPIVLTSGGALDRFAAVLGDLDARSLDHQHAVAFFRGARRVCTTPGLTTILELAALRTPMSPLPPENYSQLLNLRQLLSRHGDQLGQGWRIIAKAYRAIPDGLPERDGVIAVNALNAELLGSARNAHRLGELLAAAAGEAQPLPTTLLSPISGADVIATDTAKFLGLMHVAVSR
jgi:hypothetical protein